MIFVASPYTANSPGLVRQRVTLVTEFTAEGMRAGYVVYSPILYCHSVAQEHDLPTTAEFWRPYSEEFLERAQVFVVLQLPLWEKSKGVLSEMEYWRTKLHGTVRWALPPPEQDFKAWAEQWWAGFN